MSVLIKRRDSEGTVQPARTGSRLLLKRRACFY
jgi:hypothetical protein